MQRRVEIDQYSSVEIMPLEGVYPVQLGRVKATLIECDGRLLVVDTGMTAGDAETILSFARSRLNMPLEECGEVCVITHRHRDHVGGLKRLKESCSFKVASYIDEAEAIESATSLKVDVKLGDREVLPYCGGIQFIHVPGHTVGNICLLVKEMSLLIAGDTVFADEKGTLSPPPDDYCTDPEMAKRELRTLQELHFDNIIVSHGRDTLGAAKRRINDLLDPLNLSSSSDKTGRS